MEEPSATRVERRKVKTREILMRVALELFYENGIYWTTVEDITERADVGKGTFYQHFETKEALLQALLQQGLDVLLARKAAAIRGTKPGPQAIHAIIQAQVSFYLEHPEYLLYFHQIRGLLQLKSKTVKDLRSAYDEHLNQLGHRLRPALNGKANQDSKARKLGMAISAFTSGLLTYHLLFGRSGNLKHQRDEIQSELERSVQTLM